jgi:hypothetical protein
MQPDYLPMGHFEQINFHDTIESAMFWMASPSPGWANPDDCGPFTCTGPYNTIAKMEGTTYTGDPRAFLLPKTF